MRILLLFLLIFNSLQSQEIDSTLVPYVEEYIKEAEKYDIEVKSKIWELEYIKYDDLPYNKLGTYTGNGILLNKIQAYHPKLIRAVFYHEMGHVIGLPHMCKECPYLMSAFVGQISFGAMDDDEWEYYKKIYFYQIKQYEGLIKVKIEKNGKTNRERTKRDGSTKFGFE